MMAPICPFSIASGLIIVKVLLPAMFSFCLNIYAEIWRKIINFTELFTPRGAYLCRI
jgi:hypothetical protein